MGRSKPFPKRRRIDEEEDEKSAIASLQSLPPDAVEAAAAVAVRADINTWHHLDCGKPESPFTGLARCTINKSDFEVFRRLHDGIQQQASASMTSWSGSVTDPRRRAFGFLPGTLGYDDKVRSTLDISQPNASTSAAELERPRNAKAMVVLNAKENEPLLENVQGAMECLLSQLRPFVQPKELQQYLKYDQLVAAQPNLHKGRHLLPMHVDHPSKDGFGIIIVTIAIRGSADIMLESVSKEKAGSRGVFDLAEGQAYMLSGPVRNSCQHGVLAKEDSGQRESLNLRFALHGLVEGTDPPAWDVLQHWSEVGVEESK